MQVELFLLGPKGFQVLKSICEAGYKEKLKTVIAASDEGVEDDFFETIKNYCRQERVAFASRKEFDGRANNTVCILAGWKWILNDHHHCIVLHDSLLPAYRGFAPLVNALINGEPEIGVTALYAGKEYDTGPIIAQESISIDHPVRIQYAIDQVSLLYGKLAVDIIRDLSEGSMPSSVQQDETEASYSLWRDEKDYDINWNEDSDRICRTIFAVGSPYKKARTTMNGQTIVIDDAEVVRDVMIMNRQPGKVIFMEDGKPVVVCGNGLLKITAASYASNGVSIFPLKKFRTRFGE